MSRSINLHPGSHKNAHESISASAVAVDLGIVVVFVAYGIALLAGRDDLSATPADYAVLLAVGGALVFRRLAPLTLLVVLLTLRVWQNIGGDVDAHVTTALAIAVFTVAHHRRLAVAVTSTVATIAVFLATAGDLSPFGIALIGSTTIYFCASGAAGAALHRVQQINAQLDDALTELRASSHLRERAAVLTDRERIRGELHDIVGHHVNVALVVAQAASSTATGGVQQAAEAFRTIETTCRTALDEMDRTTDALAEAGSGAARIDSYAEVARSLRDAGYDITVNVSPHDDALADLPPETSVVAMRFLQEALTNTIKHARSKRIELRISASDDLVVTVSSEHDLAASSSLASPIESSSTALLRRRINDVGGELQMGPDGDRFTQTARIPVP